MQALKQFFSKLYQIFLDYVVKDRQTPAENRKRVGQNLMILSIFVFFIFLINFAVIIGTDSKFGQDLSEGASSVYQLQVNVQARRGTIYDRNGEVLAEDSTTYSVYAAIDKSYVDIDGNKLYVQSSQFDELAKIFNEQLGMDKDYVVSQLKQKNLSQTSFGSQGNGLSYSTMTALNKAIEKAGIKGVGFTAEPGRMYPNGVFASQFIGLAQLVENEKDGTKVFKGATGLEYALNDTLSGTDGVLSYQKDKNGNVLLGASTVVKKPVDGKDVYTTLSQPLQITLETQMDQVAQKIEAKNINATLVNAKTGEILATSQRPSYNADTLEGYGEQLNTYNTLLYQGQYEPGSTMKVMTLASAIDSDHFNPNEGYYNNEYQIADAVIKDWDVNSGVSEGRYLTLAQGFALSSNIAMLHLEQEMGNDLWLDYLNKFKFGVRTRFGMGNETVGNLPEKNDVSIAMSAFGQAINVTHVQMLRAFSAISNDGVMLEPHFISQIYDSNTNSSRVVGAEEVGNPVSEKAAQQTRDYMVTVGTDPQFGTLYANGPIITVNNESVAVKSGTAEIADVKNGGYLTGSNDYIQSVVAMVPSENPEFLMYVTIQQPEHWQSVVAWQGLFTPVLEEAMLMKDDLNKPVTPVSDKETAYKLPDVIDKSVGDVSDELRRQLVQPVTVGTGEKIKAVSVETGTNLSANEQLLLLTDTVEAVPDMYGWTKKNVKIFGEWTGVTIKFKGKGSKVVAQSVDSGKPLSKHKKITITLGD